MDKGIHWFSQIVLELQRSNIGIICLTPESLNSNWLHYEAGALANHLLVKEGKEEGKDPNKLVEKLCEDKVCKRPVTEVTSAVDQIKPLSE